MLAPLNSLLPDPAVPGSGGRPQGVGEVEGSPSRGASAGPAHCARRGLPRRPAGAHRWLAPLGSARCGRRPARHPHPPGTRKGGAPRPPATSDGNCRCPVVQRRLGPTAIRPPPLRSGDAARDHGCRQPGCRNRAGWTDLDHVIPHAEGGPTGYDNLCCLCRRHQLKTHAPGWAYLDADGALLVTTPSGVTRISRPPGSHLLEPFELGEHATPSSST